MGGRWAGRVEGLIGPRYIVYIYGTVKEQMKHIPERERENLHKKHKGTVRKRGVFCHDWHEKMKFFP